MIGIMAPFVFIVLLQITEIIVLFRVVCSTVHMIFVVSCVGIFFRGSKVSTLRPTGSAWSH
jgi:hypothetical protein